jgi:hypothetical protein
MAERRISHVVDELWAIAARAEQTGSRLGFFAALYARVTAAIAAHIDERFFDDGPRMERLDVTFADLYIQAVKGRLEGADGVRQAWTVAFDACKQRAPTVLQHLYLGMNAHLLVDLPLAVATVASPSTVASLCHDFRKINEVVDAEMGAFHDDLCKVSPRLERWHRRSARLWAASSNVTLFGARELAFYRAKSLVRAGAGERERLIEGFDRGAAWIGREGDLSGDPG